MKQAFVLIAALAWGTGLAAADLSPTAATAVSVTAQVTPAPVATVEAKAPAPLAPPWDKVVLKDGQKLEGKIRNYDAYFLEVEAANSHHFSLPWREVASVQPAEFSGDTALMKSYVNAEPVEVSSHAERKDPDAALHAALWPGVVAHGWGYKVTGNRDMFYSLVCAEAFGVVMAGVGAGTVASSNPGDNTGMATAMLWGGVGVFVASWAWDIVGAPMSARDFNQKNGLTLLTVPLPQGGALLGMSLNY